MDGQGSEGLYYKERAKVKAENKSKTGQQLQGQDRNRVEIQNQTRVKPRVGEEKDLRVGEAK